MLKPKRGNYLQFSSFLHTLHLTPQKSLLWKYVLFMSTVRHLATWPSLSQPLMASTASDYWSSSVVSIPFTPNTERTFPTELHSPVVTQFQFASWAWVLTLHSASPLTWLESVFDFLHFQIIYFVGYCKSKTVKCELNSLFLHSLSH